MDIYTDNVKLSKALKLAPRDVKVGLEIKHYEQRRDFMHTLLYLWER